MDSQKQIRDFIKKVIFFYMDIPLLLIKNESSLNSLGIASNEQIIILKQLEGTYGIKFLIYKKFCNLSLTSISKWIKSEISQKP